MLGGSGAHAGTGLEGLPPESTLIPQPRTLEASKPHPDCILFVLDTNPDKLPHFIPDTTLPCQLALSKGFIPTFTQELRGTMADSDDYFNSSDEEMGSEPDSDDGNDDYPMQSDSDMDYPDVPVTPRVCASSTTYIITNIDG